MNPGDNMNTVIDLDDQEPTVIDPDDTALALVRHASGAEYVVEIASLWRDTHCVGERIVRVSDALDERFDVDRNDASAVLHAVARYDREQLSDWDADWLQAEDEAGRVEFPYGMWVP